MRLELTQKIFPTSAVWTLYLSRDERIPGGQDVCLIRLDCSGVYVVVQCARARKMMQSNSEGRLQI
jgi:hypothetical protein